MVHVAEHPSPPSVSPSSHSSLPPTMPFPQPAVVKLHTGPCVVLVPSPTVTYHSYSVFAVRPGHDAVVLDPYGTLVLLAIWVNPAPPML